ncbi:hypothetical protein M9Y10_021150 [Tritrichomonas musculus]|uniref:Uncharacterized protein n=1 Tax=Tritrichomonas musculus TaxID=1915356 RepID=A0ABR2HE86_9EUKA
MSDEQYEIVETLELEEEEEEADLTQLVDSDESDGEDDETLEILIRNEKSHTNAAKAGASESPVEETQTELIENSDNFVRAFLTQMRLHETLNVFQAEWYRLEATNSLDRSQIGKIPLMYLDYFYLDQKLRKLESEVNRMKKTATKVQEAWKQLKVERDENKLAHMRVGHEKQAILKSMHGLLHQTKLKMPTLDDYNSKIESADKDRMLLELDVQRLRQVHERLLASQPKPEPVEVKPKKPEPVKKEPINIKSILPGKLAQNPYTDANKASLEQLTHRVVHKAHETPVSSVAVHPKRKAYATAGEDGIWHVWNAENSELLISGCGHTSWISNCAFHPRGVHLATTSADGTTRIWDFLSSKCTLILNGHLSCVWGCDFHFGGRVIATCGADATIRTYDLQGGQEATILRDHNRDVNVIKWIPYTNMLVSGGADHVVGLWDAREGTAMINRGLGHTGAIFGVAPSLNGRYVCSGDCKGAVKVWDIRKMETVTEFNYTSQINSVALDVTGSYVFAACDDGKAQVFSVEDSKSSWTISSFDMPCESIAVNNDCDMVICGATDGNISACTNQ